MRAKTVNENMNFQRGKDVKTIVGIGDPLKSYAAEMDIKAEEYGFTKVDSPWPHKWEQEPGNKDTFWIGLTKDKVGDRIHISYRGKHGHGGLAPNHGLHRFAADEFWASNFFKKTVSENLDFKRGGIAKNSIGIGEEGKLSKKYGAELGHELFRLKPILDEYKFKIKWEDLISPQMIIYSQDNEDDFHNNSFTVYYSEFKETLVGEFEPNSITTSNKPKGSVKPLGKISKADFIRWFGSSI